MAFIVQIPSYDIDVVWPRVEPLLQLSVERAVDYTTEALRGILKLSKAQLWIVGAFVAVIVTEVQERPKNNVLFILHTAGADLPEWLDEWMVVQDEFARCYNCIAVEADGRLGWKKYLRRYPDFKPVTMRFRREIPNG